MPTFIHQLFSSGSFIPHGHCYLWNPTLVWLNVISDTLIALAYYSIPILLIYIVRQRGDLPFDGVFFLFGGFILACGTGHLLDVWTLWYPAYWLVGVVKAMTAGVSLATGAVLIWLIPSILAIPSNAQLEAANRSLEEARAAADAANQAKSDFLANMSHELRTPLNGILGYAQILQRTEPLSAKGRQGVSIVQQCGSHLLTLINDILDLSKIEARKMDLLPTAFHLPSFLQSVAEICRVRAEQKGIDFTYALAADLPQGIQADEKRLRQVLINLLSNAIKFTDAGGVTFQVQVQATDSRKRDNSSGSLKAADRPERGSPRTGTGDESDQVYRLRFQVEDTGLGMTPTQLEKIFLPFEQVGDAKKQQEGTGLGLAISRTIVDLMGSELHVESTPGQGSCFWFEVDLVEAQDWASASRVVSQGVIVGYHGPKRRVLVVDDRWENRSVIVNLLEPIGFEVKEANNGQAGVDLAAEFQPDVIVTDLMMPVLDGYGLLRQVRQVEGLRQVVAIASSASVFESNQHESFDAGADAFLPKPVDAEALLKLIREHTQLEWIYDSDLVASHPPQPTLPTVTESNRVPAPEVLHQLYQLAQDGDIQGILDQAEQISTVDPQLQPFAQNLTQLAHQFQITQIMALLERHLRSGVLEES